MNRIIEEVLEENYENLNMIEIFDLILNFFFKEKNTLWYNAKEIIKNTGNNDLSSISREERDIIINRFELALDSLARCELIKYANINDVFKSYRITLKGKDFISRTTFGLEYEKLTKKKAEIQNEKKLQLESLEQNLQNIKDQLKYRPLERLITIAAFLISFFLLLERIGVL